MIDIEVKEIDWVLEKEHIDAIVFGLKQLDLTYAPVTLIIECSSLGEGHHGDTVDLDEEIVLRLSNDSEWRRTLWHELAHVKQYVNDELELESEYAVWKGKLIKRTEYWDEPWEVEAREVEEKLEDVYRRNYELHQV